MTAPGNLFADAEPDPAGERFDTLLAQPGIRVERIISTGQASPPGFWYDQPLGEWILLMSGSATLEFEGDAAPRRMKPGDYLWIAPHRRHRVTETDRGGVTIWLAIHHGAVDGAEP